VDGCAVIVVQAINLRVRPCVHPSVITLLTSSQAPVAVMAQQCGATKRMALQMQYQPMQKLSFVAALK